MPTHQEIRERKAERLGMVFEVVRKQKTEVKLNDLYRRFGKDVWNTNAYFIQDVINSKHVGISIHAKKKSGTFAVAVGKPSVRVKELTMGGLFPQHYEGRYTDIKPTRKWKKVRELPKAFKDFAGETAALFRFEEIGKTVQYLQVTLTGERFLFNQV